MYVLNKLRDEDLTELSLKQVIIDLRRLIPDVAVDQVVLCIMVIFLTLVEDLPKPRTVNGALQTLDGVDAFGAAYALGALEAADGLLGLE